MNNQTAKSRGCVLIVSSSKNTITSVENVLSQEGFYTVVASDQDQALSLFKCNEISYVLIDAECRNTPANELVSALRGHFDDQYVPVIILASPDDEEVLSHCISSRFDDFLFKPVTALTFNARIASLEQMRELERLYKSSVNEQLVAMRILTNALEERSIQFEDIKLLSRSKAVFSGDLFLTARHPDGSLNVLLADFTGHGLSAAIGALPVADIFSVMTEKGFELDFILERINSKIHTLLPTSMFMACCVLNITSDLKYVRVWNGGMPDIYIREHQSGRISHKIKSTHLPLGINETMLNRFELEVIDLTPDDQLILYTDGLTEALNADGDMFGVQCLEQCLENTQSTESIFPILVDSFNKFCGEISPLDDVTLVCIPCNKSLMHSNEIDTSKNMKIANSRDKDWCWYMELGGSSLHEVNPVPIVLNEIHKISGPSVSIDKLSSIMSVLYKNAIEIDFSNNSINKYSEDIYIRIGIKKVEHNGGPALLVRMEDSGKGVTHDELIRFLNNISEDDIESCSDEAKLLYELNKSSKSQGVGNRLEAIICESH